MNTIIRNKHLAKLSSQTIASLLFLIILGLGTFYALTGYMEFDEGFNLQIPVSLVRNGTYATTYETGKAFDPVITTGPTVLLPIAASFKIFGIGIIQARPIVLVYFVLLLVLIVFITKQLSGMIACIVSLILLGSLPDIFLFSLKILGEIPALVFLLIGLIVFSKNKRFISGVFLGLAGITKFIFLLGLIAPFAFFMKDLYYAEDKRKPFKSALSLMTGVLIPFASWECYRFLTLGWPAYRHNIKETILFLNALAHQGSSTTTKLMDHLYSLSIPFGRSWTWAVFIIWLFILGYSQYRYRKSFSKDVHNFKDILGESLSIFAIAYLVWWFIDRTSRWRYLIPDYIIFSIFAGLFLEDMYRNIKTSAISLSLDSWKSSGYKVVLALLFFGVCILVPLRNQIPYLYKNFNQNYQDQIILAQKIRLESEQGAYFGYWGWFQVPELSFLSLVKFYDISKIQNREWFDSMAQQGHPIYIIVSRVQWREDKNSFDETKKYLGDPVISNVQYQIYNFKD